MIKTDGKILNKPELLAPAGDMEKLKVAFHFGADAVYVGLPDFSLRANTKNFNEEELTEAVTYTHDLQKKIYVALNIYFTPDQIDGLIYYLKFIKKTKPDGIILSDLGAVYLAKKYAQDIPIHISTQANTTNQYAVRLLEDLGVNRIVLARELTLENIKKIKKTVKTDLETFVHGAMCIAYSGRCLLSAYMTHNQLGSRDNEEKQLRSANQGFCSHSCRWEFIIKEKSRLNQEYPVEQNSNGTYIFSSKDICMIDHIDNLIEAGIGSFKIEGRMKSILYISSIVRAYRQAIDNRYDKKINYDREEIEKELNVVSHREFCTGFFYDKPQDNPNITKGGIYKRKIRLAALIIGVNENRAILKIYNTFGIKDNIEYIAPFMKTIQIGKIEFYDKENMLLDKINHNDTIEAIMFDKKGNFITPEKLDILRIESNF